MAESIDEQLNEMRLSGKTIRVVRDAIPDNDLFGTVVAWDATHVILRKRNRKVVKVSKEYTFQYKE
jgi:RNase P/RNase MRP subunit p29